jgi:hypothetical protein
LKISQCRTSSVFFIGAVSGSIRMSAKLTVPSGTFAHVNFGDTGVPSAAIVNLFGMMPPSSNPSVVSANLGFVGAGGPGVCAIVPAAAEIKTRAVIHDFMLLSLPWKSFNRSDLGLERANCK